MVRLLLSRALQAVPTLFLVSVVAFGLIAAAPVDPARMALSSGGAGAQLDEREVEAKRAELGLDRPLLERYLRWWGGLLRLDFGQSFASGRPVASLLAERLPASLVLGLLAFSLSLALSVPLGMLSALRAGGAVDQATRVLALLSTSLPGFWLALLLTWLFAAHLRWVPALGSLTPAGIILPALVLAVRPLGRQVRLLRATTLDALTMDHLVVARAKGLACCAMCCRTRCCRSSPWQGLICRRCSPARSSSNRSSRGRASGGWRQRRPCLGTCRC